MKSNKFITNILNHRIITLTIFAIFFSTNIVSASSSKMIPPAKFYEGFEHHFQNQWEASGNPYMINGLTDEVSPRGGDYSVRSVIGENYGNNNIVMQSESGIKTSNAFGWMKQIPVGEDRWYGFSAFIPSNFKPDVKGHQDIFFQIIDTDFTKRTSPVVALSIKGNKFNITARGGKLDRNHWPSEQSRSFATIIPGTWNDFVLKVHIDEGKKGKLDVYHNGKNVFNYQGPIGRRDRVKVLSEDLKSRVIKYRAYDAEIGLEKPEWRIPREIKRSSNAGIDYRVMYFDELRVTDSKNGYEIVSPSRKKTDPVLWLDKKDKENKYSSSQPSYGGTPANTNSYARTKTIAPTYHSSPAIPAGYGNSTAIAPNSQTSSDITEESSHNNYIKEKPLPSAGTAISINEHNSDGSPFIRQIEFSFAEPIEYKAGVNPVKLTQKNVKADELIGNEPLIIKWNVKGDKNIKCQRSGSWSGNVGSNGEYFIEVAQYNSRFILTCGWGEGKTTKALLMVDKKVEKQTKEQHQNYPDIMIVGLQ